MIVIHKEHLVFILQRMTEIFQPRILTNENQNILLLYLNLIRYIIYRCSIE